MGEGSSVRYGVVAYGYEMRSRGHSSLGDARRLKMLHDLASVSIATRHLDRQEESGAAGSKISVV